MESLRSHKRKSPKDESLLSGLGLFFLSDWPVAGEGMGYLDESA